MDQQADALAASVQAQLLDPNILAQLHARCGNLLTEKVTEGKQ